MPFKPGQSGNPAGRPKGTSFAEMIRKATRDGRVLMDAWLLIATGSNDDIAQAYGARATIRDRMAALDALADRGHGKPTQPVSGEDGGPIRVIFGGRHKAHD